MEKTTLDDVCIKITDGAHKSPKSVESGRPMGSVKDLEFYGLNLETARHISEEDYFDLVKQGCKPELGDVLIAKDGNSALDTVCAFEKDDEVVLLSSVAILRPNPEKINSRFLKYYFLSVRTIEYLKRNFISGAAIPRVVLRDFKKAEIQLPLLSEQKAITHFLGSLDDKIELNRQMNETLEAMSQALFKSWFVDFDPVIDNALAAGNAIPDELLERAEQRKTIEKKDNSDIQDLFPDYFEFTEEMGWIPKGWQVKNSGDLFDVRDGTHDSPKKSDEGKYLITSRHITSGVIDYPNAYLISQDDFDEVNKRSLVESYDILITMIGTVGVSMLVLQDEIDFAIKNVGLFKTSNNKSYAVFFYLYLNSNYMTQFLDSRLAGTTQKYLTLKVLRALPVVTPNNKILSRFVNEMSPIFKKIHSNHEQIETLSKLRDTLLPRLMSGELRIPDAADLMDEVL